MTIALVTHPACLDHNTGPGHPERADRLRAVLAALGEERFPGLLRVEAPAATVEQLGDAHSPKHVSGILDLAVAEGERAALDAGTIVSHGSVEAAIRAAGGAVLAVDLVMEGRADAVFAAVRPPGHHAEPDQPMGFCLFNNVVVAARHARRRWGLSRIAVADFDVHHGNGTQAAFWDDPQLFFASTHQSPFYPGTGERHERGRHNNIANAPLAAGSGSEAFRRAWRHDLLPALDAFVPELLIISAGFDGHRDDPLAEFELDTDDFAWITSELVALAGRHASGRVISLLEGGYHLGALAECGSAHVHALCGISSPAPSLHRGEKRIT
jgi:acetoin utilization deacetylase AcuC-like enzyme